MLWSQLSPDTRITVIAVIVASILGGLISLVSSVTVFTRSVAEERRRREAEKRERDIANAFSGLTKLIHIAEAIENLARHLDKEFAESSRNDGLREPTSFVRQIVGSNVVIEKISAEEIFFIMRNDGDLAAEISEIQQRAINHMEVANSYSFLRRDLDDFTEKHATLEVEEDATSLGAKFEGGDALVAKLKFARGNQILAHLVVALEEDRRRAGDILRRYAEKARERFGDDFPVQSLEFREPPC